MDFIRLEQPAFALLALPLIVALAWAEVVAARERRPLRLAARALLAVCLAVALAGPRGSGGREPRVVFALDVSRSTGDSERLAKTVEHALAAGRVPVAGWTVFAGASESLPVGDLPPDSGTIGRAALRLDPTRTDVGLGLRAALGSALGDAPPLVALVSDGLDTEGQAVSAAMECRARGATVFALTPSGGDERDVRVESLLSPSSVEEGRPFTLAATISSSQPERATVVLERDGSPVARAGVRLRAGAAERVVFTDAAEASGVARYRARVEAAGGPDSWPENDFVEASVRVVGRPRILVVGDDPLLADLLARDTGRFVVETAAAGALPADWRGLERYSAVALEDVPRSRVSASQESALAEYVNRGGGLLAMGGPSAFGAGGWRDSDRLAALLPVRVEAAPDESALLVILLDASGSMAMEAAPGVRKMYLAREAVAAALAELSSRDSIAVVTFSGEAEVAAHARSVAERAAILDKLAEIEPRGPTAFGPPLARGLEIVSRSDAGMKLVVLISDGEPTLAHSPDDLAEMASRYIEFGARLHAVGTGAADGHAALLARLASAGGGELRIEPDFSRLAATLGEVLRRATGRHVREGPAPLLRAAPHDIVSGLDAPPPLGAINRTEIRPEAVAILSAPGGEPALAFVRRGAGAVAVFAGALEESWAGEFGRWPGRLRLFSQTLRALSARDISGGVSAEVRGGGDEARLSVSLGRDLLELSVEFIDSDGVFTARAEQTGLGRYEAPLPDALGRSFVAAVSRAGPGREVIGSFPLTRPLPPEFLRTGVDLPALAEIAEAGGGRRLAGPHELAEELEAMRRLGERDITHVFAAMALLIMLLELAARLTAARAGRANS